MVGSETKKGSEKLLAEESPKTKKAREKLQKRFQQMDAQMTREALHQKSVEIHRWISRHAERRIPLREKTISLFDEGENIAQVSEKVEKVAQQLRDLFK